MTKLQEIEQEKIIHHMEDILSAITDFLEITLEYDFQIESYKTPEGEEREFIKINLFGEDESVLIGYHGKTLDNLQRLMSLSMSTALEQKVKVVLEAGNYRKNRQETLINLAQRAKEQVHETGSPIQLDPMNASERRIIHQELSSEEKITTESIGEGRNRRIVIKQASSLSD